MRYSSIINPRTGRSNRVRAWDIDVKALWEQIKANQIQSARDVSVMLLNDDDSIQAMVDEEYGDSAECNFALSVFENALDFTLGMAVLWFFQVCCKAGKLPGPFSVVATRKGDIFIVGQKSGHVYDPYPPRS